MTSLTSPINAQNIVDKFAEYVPPAANTAISWATNSVPFGEMSTGYFGGDTSGKPIGISGSNFNADIKADDVYNVILGETQQYARIRRMRAILNVTGGGGNTGSRGSPGVVFDQTAMSHLNSDYAQSVTADRSDVNLGNMITPGGLETLFTNMRTGYTNVRENVATIQIDVCHASCHSSCHSSRGRR